MAELNSPMPAEWGYYVTQSTVKLEVIPAVLYDTVTYTDNVSTELVFFTTQRATRDLSNMPQPAPLPNPQSFLVQAIRVYFKQPALLGTTAAGSAINDIALLTNTGVLSITIGTKTYGIFPLWMFASGSQPDGPLAGANSNFLGYAQLRGYLMALFPHLMLSPLQPFQVNLNWPAGAVDLSGNVVVQVVLEGQLARAVQ